MILKTLGITALLGLTSFGLLGKFEQSMVYPLDPTEVSPANAGVPQMQAVRFTSDKETLVLWVAKPKAGKPVILYFQGNAETLPTARPALPVFKNAATGWSRWPIAAHRAVVENPRKRASCATRSTSISPCPIWLATRQWSYMAKALGPALRC